MREGTIQRQLVWLMIFRVVIITSLMGTLLVIQLSPEGESVPHFEYIYHLSGLTYGLSILYLLLFRRFSGSVLYVYLQFLGDVAIETGLVYYTGGAESPFSFLYLFSIITASIMLFRRGGFIIASLSGIAYGLLIDLLYLGAIRPAGGSAQVSGSLYHHFYIIFLHFFAFYAVAWMVSYLSENLRRTGSQLEEKSGHLADLQAFNEMVINSMSSGLITLDLAGRVTKVNEVALKITGCVESDLLGRDLLELLGLDRRLLNLVRRRLARRRIYRFDMDVQRKDGVSFPVGVSVSSLEDKSRRPLGYIVIFQDLTELRQLEEELRMKDRLAVVGQLAAGVAHEIRNPLASISGSAQLLQGDGEADSEEGHLLAIIHRESRRLERTIQDFLNFSRPTSRKREQVNLSALIGDTVTLLRNSEELLPGHRLELSLPDTDVLVLADGDRIRQVIWNVCRNGLAAMADGGSLTVRLLPPDGGMAAMEFVDEGEGFTEGGGEDFFQPFVGKFQRGAGLGLAIVNKTVRSHGGKVTIRNNPTGGATVRVDLPLHGSLPAGRAAREE